MPERRLDTRPGAGQTGYVGSKPAADSTVELTVTGGIVPAGAEAVVLNVTATEADAPGFVTVWPCGQERPIASSLNLPAGGTRPNLVITKLGVSGKVCIYTQEPVHLVVDVDAYFP